MPQRLQSKGFSVVEVLVVLVIIAVLALGGFFVWQRNKDDDAKTKNNTSQNNTDNKDNEEEPKDEEPADPSEGGKYLVIDQWGMRFELPVEYRGDVEYGIFTFDNGDQAAYFTSKKITAVSTFGCGLEQRDDSAGQGVRGGLVAIIRTEANPEDVSDQLSFHQGEHWYTVGFSNGGACYEGDTGEETGAFKSAMDSAVRGLEPVEQ
jgi:prepilin-type N-terminal cleavage/methylation domain-containing protein